MQLSPDQLTTHLQQGLAALYVIHSDEALLQLEAVDQLRQSARQQGYTEREVFTVEGRFDWQQLLHSGASLSLFAERRIVELRIPGGKPGAEGSKVLQEYCAQLPADTLTLITLPRLDKTSQSSVWFKALDKAGVSIAIPVVERHRLPQWIEQRLARQQQFADRDVLQFLTERVEGNLLAAEQEIRKLGLLLPAGKLAFAAVENAVLDVARFDVYKLSEAILAGDVARTGKTLTGLKDEGTAPTILVWKLADDVRALARLKAAQQAGQPLTGLWQQLRIWDSRKPLYEKALGRLSLKALHYCLTQLTEVDRAIKGIGSGEPWARLEALTLTLARGKLLVKELH